MRIMLVHPNYHSGGAEIARNWPPAWAAYIAGALKRAGFTDIVFVDAMTNHLDDEAVRARIAAERPDLVGVTAITPSIYKAERVLAIAKEVRPEIVTVLGGIHATFMYRQVLAEAPWIDAIVRGEGEEIIVDLARTVADGRWPAARDRVDGIAYLDGERIVATRAAPTVKDLDGISPDWGVLEWEKYTYIPLGKRVAIPNMARGIPVALGLDEAGINDDRDMLQEMRLALSLHREPGIDSPHPTPSQILRMASERGAATTPFGARIGRLAPGCEADVVLFDWDAVTRPYQNPDIPPIDVLVQRAKSATVKTVMIAGETVYRDGTFTRVDKTAVLDEIAAFFGRPLTDAEQARRRLARDVFPHVKAFYAGYLDGLGNEPFYRPSGRY